MSLGLVPQIANTAALRYFFEVARHGSFRAAGEKVNIAPSAINRQIRLLEEELGVELFERGRGRAGCRLTAAGEAMLYRLTRAMHELSTARAEIDALQGLHHGRITLGVNDTVGREFAVGFLAEFCVSHPAVTFEVRTGNSPELLDLMMRDEVDLILASGIAPQRDIQVIAAAPTRMFLMLRQDHALAVKSEIPLSDLVDERLIMPSQGIALRQVVDGMLARGGQVPRSTLSTTSFELMADMVAAGMGLGFQARVRGGADPLRPALRYIPLADAPARSSVLACCIRAGRSPSAAMAEFLRRVTRALSAWFETGNLG